MIIRPGEGLSQEIKDKKNSLKRGVVAKKKFDDARAAFAIFQQEEVVEDPKSRIRAGKMYAGYLAWEAKRTGEKAPPMSMRMFGLLIRRHYVAKRGQGRTIIYPGIGLRTAGLGEEIEQESPARGW